MDTYGPGVGLITNYKLLMIIGEAVSVLVLLHSQVLAFFCEIIKCYVLKFYLLLY